MKCLRCDDVAEWVRCTQFAGDHPFCKIHAELEKDFKKDGSWLFWREVKLGVLYKIVLEMLKNENIDITFPDTSSKRFSWETLSRWIIIFGGGYIEYHNNPPSLLAWVDGENNPGDWLTDHVINAINLATPGTDLEPIIESAKDIVALSGLVKKIAIGDPEDHPSRLEAIKFKDQIQKVEIE